MVARHQASAREYGVELAAEGVESWVEADHDRVLQIGSNLVENALRETPAAGSVTVRAEPGALIVSDTGPGLDPTTSCTRSTASSSTTSTAANARSAAASGSRS